MKGVVTVTLEAPPVIDTTPTTTHTRRASLPMSHPLLASQKIKKRDLSSSLCPAHGRALPAEHMTYMKDRISSPIARTDMIATAATWISMTAHLTRRPLNIPTVLTIRITNILPNL